MWESYESKGDSQDKCRFSFQAAVEEHCRLGSLNSGQLFSRFWRLVVWDQGAASLVPDETPSHCVFTWRKGGPALLIFS